jgi:hypothetical protein
MCFLKGGFSGARKLAGDYLTPPMPPLEKKVKEVRKVNEAIDRVDKSVRRATMPREVDDKRILS